MDRQEFSYRFDILYNNISSNAAPGINEYEKSVFLTKAQDEIVKNYFNARGNKYREGFEETEKRKMDFSNILVVKYYDKGQDVTADAKGKGIVPFHKKGILYEWPDDLLFVADETVVTDQDITLSVVPMDNINYMRLMSKPYQYPTRSQCWRMVHTIPNALRNMTTGSKTFYTELVTSLNIETYTLRYVKQPYPIILCTIGDRTSSPVEVVNDLSINGYTFSGGTLNGVATIAVKNLPACELDEYLHEEILQRAVELAKAAYAEENAAATMQVGQRSE